MLPVECFLDPPPIIGKYLLLALTHLASNLTLFILLTHDRWSPPTKKKEDGLQTKKKQEDCDDFYENYENSGIRSTKHFHHQQ